MKLDDWLKAEGRTQEEFGLLLVPPVTQGRLSHWVTGRHRIPLAYAVQVKRLTSGVVAEEDWLEPSDQDQELRAPAEPTAEPVCAP